MDDFEVYVIGSPSKLEAGEDVAAVPGKSENLHSVRSWMFGSAREVSSEKLLQSFDKTQQAIEAMLKKIDLQEDRGFALNEFEVSLSISGEGTIGFATATAEAGIVLKFARKR